MALTNYGGVSAGVVKAASLKIEAQFKREIQDVKNPLKSLLLKDGKTVERETVKRYVGKVEYASFDTTPYNRNALNFGADLFDGITFSSSQATEAARFPTTPDPTYPDFTTLATQLLSDRIRVALPEWDARVLGEKVGKLQSLIQPEMLKARTRSEMVMLMLALRLPRKILPNIDNANTLEFENFPVAQNYIPYTKSGSNLQSSISLKTLMWVENHIANLLQRPVTSIAGNADETMSASRGYYLTSNTAFTAFLDANYSLLTKTNEGMAMRKMISEGQSEGIMKIFDRRFIVVPDDTYEKVFGTGVATIPTAKTLDNIQFGTTTQIEANGTPYVAKGTKYVFNATVTNNTDVVNAFTASNVRNKNYLSMVMFYPSDIYCSYVSQFNHPWDIILDPNRENLKSIFSKYAIESCRDYKESVHVIWFDPKDGTNLITS